MAGNIVPGKGTLIGAAAEFLDGIALHMLTDRIGGDRTFCKWAQDGVHNAISNSPIGGHIARASEWLADDYRCEWIENAGNTVNDWIDTGTTVVNNELHYAGNFVGSGFNAAGDFIGDNFIGNGLNSIGNWFSRDRRNR